MKRNTKFKINTSPSSEKQTELQYSNAAITVRYCGCWHSNRPAVQIAVSLCTVAVIWGL
jgi:hypothetical protein